MSIFRRWEFYKLNYETLAVTTSEQCNEDGFQDAWCYNSRTKKLSHCGVRPSMRGWTVITEKEALKRAPCLTTEVTTL